MKKVFTLLCFLLVAMAGGSLYATDVTTGEETTITVSTDYGTLTRSGSTGYTWNNAWTSTSTSPQLTVTASANNMESTSLDGGWIDYRSGSNASCDYTIEVSDGYVITGYSFSYYGAYDDVETITIGETTYTVTTTSQSTGTDDETKVTVDNAQTLTLTVASTGTNANTSGSNGTDYNSAVYLTDFYVYVAEVSEVTFIVSTDYGTLTRSGSTGSTWNNAWTSTSTSPQLTVTASANNMESTSLDGGWIDYRSGSNASCDYTIEVSDGYVITGYSFSYYGAYDDVETITIGETTYTVTTTSQSTGTDDETKVTVDNAQTLTLTIASTGTNANTSGSNGTDYNSAVYLTDFYVYVEPAETVTLTYNIYLEESSDDSDEETTGTLIDTIEVSAYVGYDYPTELTPNVSFYTITTDLPTGTVSESETITLYAEANYPFTPTDADNLSTSSTDATWYLMYIDDDSANILARLADDNNYVSCYASGSTVQASLELSDDLGDFLWAFVPTGNFGEFYVYNAGAEGYLTTSSTSSGTYAVASSENTTGTAYKLVENTNGTTAGFALVMSDDTNATLNQYSGSNSAGYLRIYNNSSTATSGTGSLLNVLAITGAEGFEYVFGEELLAFSYYYTEYTTYLQNENYVGLPTNLTETMLAACEAYSAGTVSGMYEAFAAGETDVDLDFLEFSANQLYRIKNYAVALYRGNDGNNSWVGQEGGYITYSSEAIEEALQCYDADKDDPNAVWQFIAYTGDDYDGYYIYLPNQGQYIGTVSTEANFKEVELTSDIDEAGIYTYGSMAAQASGLAQVYLSCVNVSSSISTLLGSQYGTLGLVNRGYISNGANGYYCWFLEPADTLNATLSTVEDTAEEGLGSGNYATIYYPWAVQIPDDVTAYSLSASTTSEEVTYLVLSEIEDGIVPAQTGVILKSEESTAPSYIILSSSDTEVSSCLSGVYVETEASELSDDSSYEDIYIFATGEDGLAFYWLPSGTTTLAANKAYYKKESLSDATTESVIKFGFGSSSDEDVETGIALTELVESSSSESIYYDLSGRRVSKPTTGVYIRNGHKVILK